MAEKPHAKEHILEDREIEKIKENIETNEEKLIFNGLIYTGMRITEFLNLRRSWINWDKKRIRVPKKDDNPPFSVKTENSARVIPIVPELEPILKKFFDHYRVVKKFHTAPPEGLGADKNFGRADGDKALPARGQGDVRHNPRKEGLQRAGDTSRDGMVEARNGKQIHKAERKDGRERVCREVVDENNYKEKWGR